MLEDFEEKLASIFKKPTRWRMFKRKVRFFVQRWTRGWDDSETWSLDWSIAKFAVPRLKRFKELNDGHPCDLTGAEWDEIIDKMIYALSFSVEDETWFEGTREEQEAIGVKVKEGLELFGRYFRNLWW